MIPTKEWILNFKKTINSNGCWIPPNKPNDLGYVQVMHKGTSYYLHRLVITVFYDIPYHNYYIETRHASGCDRRCFNPDHLNFGSRSENANDAIKDNTHFNASKDCCPKCDMPFEVRVTKSGPNRGHKSRFCRQCLNKYKRESRRN